MKKNLRRLNRILKIFGEDSFYFISLTPLSIHLQGQFSQRMLRLANDLEFHISLLKDGMIILKRDNYMITLTDEL